MSIIIQNISTTPSPIGEQRYQLRINQRVITEFTHVREQGLTVCLQQAAKAVEKTKWELADSILHMLDNAKDILRAPAKALKEEDVWNDMPGCSVSAWKYETTNDYTRLGYWDWVDAQIEQQDNLREPPTCGHSACRQNWIDTGESDCVGYYTACCDVFVQHETLYCPCCLKPATGWVPSCPTEEQSYATSQTDEMDTLDTALKLLSHALRALNQTKNVRLRDGEYQDTYHLASEITAFLKDNPYVSGGVSNPGSADR